MSNTNQAALVTGAAKGIGKAIALALADAGFDVAVHYHLSKDAAETTCEEIRLRGVKALSLQADLCQHGQAENLVRSSHEKIGPLVVLVNNVGNYVKAPVMDMPIADWHEMLNSNLNATFYTCRAAVPLMRQHGYGRIINLGFAGAQNLIARPGITAYAIAKTGVNLLPQAIAKTEAQHGITANVVAPGVIETSISQPDLQEIPAGRLGGSEEVARLVLQLVNKDAAYITGQIIEVAGGWNL